MGHKRPKPTDSLVDINLPKEYLDYLGSLSTDSRKSTSISDPSMYYFSSASSRETLFKFDSNTEQEIKRLAKEALLEILQEMD